MLVFKQVWRLFLVVFMHRLVRYLTLVLILPKQSLDKAQQYLP